MSEPIQTDAIERAMKQETGLLPRYFFKVCISSRGYFASFGFVQGVVCTTPAAAINSLNQKLKEREKDNG